MRRTKKIVVMCTYTYFGISYPEKTTNIDGAILTRYLYPTVYRELRFEIDKRRRA